MEYYLDYELIHTQFSEPYEVIWKADSIDYGWHTFRIEAHDTSGEMDYAEADFKVVKYLVREGFEGEWVPQGWQVNSQVWGWYLSGKGAFDGEQCAATRNYHAMGEAILETPEMLIEEEGNLEFYWLDRSLDITSPLIAGYDTTYCEILVNSGGWVKLRTLSTDMVQTYYQKESIDLAQYEGQLVKFRWRDISDESLETQGTALDNIRIVTIPKPTGVKSGEEQIPVGYSLSQNYPNPFNPTTLIRYSLGESGRINLRLFDILGNEIAVLVDREETAGVHEVSFDGSNLASGVYFYNLRAGEFNETRKLMLLK